MTVLVAVALTLAPTALTPSPDLGAHAGQAMTQVASFVHDAERQHIEATMADAATQIAAFVAAVTPRPAPAAVRGDSPQPPPMAGGGGGHTDAWWQGVAICEQGGRNDPYYGYFSWMDGSAAGMTWDQQVAKSNDLLARAGREVGPWAAACVAAGYRAAAW